MKKGESYNNTVEGDQIVAVIVINLAAFVTNL